MSASAVAWVSQTVFFPAISACFRPAARAPDAVPPRTTTASSARTWSRLGCLSVPVLAPLVPAPRTWPVPSALIYPLSLVRSGGVILLSYASLRYAPPAACQTTGPAGPQWSGLQGDCAAQQEAWQGVWAQSIDGVALGLMTGAVVVAGFALVGASIGAAQETLDPLLSHRPMHQAPLKVP